MTNTNDAVLNTPIKKIVRRVVRKPAAVSAAAPPAAPPVATPPTAARALFMYKGRAYGHDETTNLIYESPHSDIQLGAFHPDQELILESCGDYFVDVADRTVFDSQFRARPFLKKTENGIEPWSMYNATICRRKIR